MNKMILDNMNSNYNINNNLKNGKYMIKCLN